MKTTQEILTGAKNASRKASVLTTDKKNTVLMQMADALEKGTALLRAAGYI